MHYTPFVSAIVLGQLVILDHLSASLLKISTVPVNTVPLKQTPHLKSPPKLLKPPFRQVSRGYCSINEIDKEKRLVSGQDVPVISN